MLFSSAVFILAFLPASLVLYHLSPGRRVKNLVLLALSLLFYAWGDPTYLWLLVLAILVNWAFARGISARSPRSKAMLACAIVVDVAILAFYKYEGFVAENLSSLLGVGVPDLDLPMPVGISYYTLKLVTYVVDVYRGDAEPRRNPLDLALYASFFPAMTAGPIVRYADFAPQIDGRKETLDCFVAGIRLFAIGLSKKVLLSNVVAILASDMLARGGSSIGAVGAWSGLLAYSMQLYFDFSGYSDMAIGISKMLGFEIGKNFNYPYISKSVTEFWRRWHISLSTFFRRYIYIPMGGSRVSDARLVLNLSVVWVLTGVWHGAAWNFIFWGVFYLIVLLGEKFVWGAAVSRLPGALRHLYVIFVFMISWALFWISDLGELGTYLAALFGTYGAFGTSTPWELQAWAYVPVLVACVVASTPLVPWVRSHVLLWCAGGPRSSDDYGVGYKEVGSEPLCDCSGYEETIEPKGRRIALWRILCVACDLVLLVLMALSIMSIVAGSFSPLIYFGF